jgi:hypothetical protein
MVLAVNAGGAEFVAQHGATPIAVRPMRSPTTGELRRAISAVPANGSTRELVVWDTTGVDATSLGHGLGVSMRAGVLSTLGALTNGISDNRKYASPVALAMEALGDRRLTIDFLNSRLAAPKQARVPRWVIYTGVAVLALVAGSAWAYSDLKAQQTQLASDKVRLDRLKPDIAAADAFVSKVKFAEGWQTTNPRYLACIRELTEAMPTDDQTYATSLVIREQMQAAKGGKTVPTGRLTCTLAGKTAGQDQAQKVVDRLSQNASFTEVKFGGTQDSGKGRDVSFSITFNYRPGKG